ncbi:hypothetical protein [Bradyrhizobium sp. RDM4]|uniref:hypothetical protein n=1 Tax=Bradyrhizobium sp. RDM4 TaxID=3378765 RepID=UPI0038FC7905
MTDDQIRHMVDRFLGWKLPENFSPDGGVSFKKMLNEHTAHPAKHEPIGTNLLDAQQATVMVRYMIDGLPAEPPTARSSAGNVDALIAEIPADLYWHIAKGKLRPDEPLYACHIVNPNNEEVIAEAEHDDLMQAVALAVRSLASGESRQSLPPTASHAEREILDQLAASVREQVSDGDGMWVTCSGCHESEDGHSIGYPHSKVFGCRLGSGCSECGGIGAIWDTTDYGAMGDALAAELDTDARISAGSDLEERVIEAITEWIGETPPSTRLRLPVKL